MVNPRRLPQPESRGLQGSAVIAAIVLAAGSSSRMGEPKPLVRLGERPMLAWVLDALRGSRVAETLVVLGDSAGRIRAEIPLTGARVVENPAFRDGMSSSLRTGIASLGGSVEAFFVVLGDAPFVRSETYDALIAARESSGSRVVVPTYHGVRGNPVLLDRSLAGEADSITGDRGCREIRQRHPEETIEVPVEDPGVLVDLDTPEDAQLARDAVRDGRSVASLVGTLSRSAGPGSRDRGPVRPRMRARERVPEGAGAPGLGPKLVVVGDSPVSECLASLGRLLGFRVVAVGPDLDSTRFPDADEMIADLDHLEEKLGADTYAVVTGMAPYEGRALAQLLRSEAPYVGLVASRRRAAALRDDLVQGGMASSDFDRVHCPAGLDIGARTPEEVALSVAAEMVRSLRARRASAA